MSNSLYKIISLENDMTELFYKGMGMKDIEFKEIVDKINNILPKLNNIELMYLLKNGSLMHEFVNVFLYFKKYKINKKEIKQENSYKEELKKLNNFVDLILDSSLNDKEYNYICNKCEVDNVASFLLKNMSNEEIMDLSNESDDWNYKLFLYGNLKE